MTSSDADSGSDADADSNSRWSLLGLGGALSLCCLFTAPAVGGAVGGSAASGAALGLGGSLVQILVAALTVGAIGAAVSYRSDCESCDR